MCVLLKALARSYIGWSGVDKEIGEWVLCCHSYQESHRAWESTRTPWFRLHLDFAGPFQGQTFFVDLDSYMKWREIVSVTTTSSRGIMRILRKLFSTHSLPDTLTTDNGSVLISSELHEFTMRNRRAHPIHVLSPCNQ